MVCRQIDPFTLVFIAFQDTALPEIAAFQIKPALPSGQFFKYFSIIFSADVEFLYFNGGSFFQKALAPARIDSSQHPVQPTHFFQRVLHFFLVERLIDTDQKGVVKVIPRC